MATSTVKIPLDNDLARIYNTASAENRRKIQLLLELGLREIAGSNHAPLAKLMDTISDNAQARGLTPELLESLLNGDE